MTSPEELLDLALKAARAAAELVRERAAEGVTVAATKSSEVDVVTQADRDSEALIRSIIGAARPDDSFLGEEGGLSHGTAAGTSEVRWVVDPIDGTVNFLYGIPRYAVSIAAELARPGGEPEVEPSVVVGVVIDVPHGIEFTARRTDDGIVARRDNKPVRVRERAPLGQRLLATGFNYDADLRRAQAEALVRLLPRVRDVRRAGAAALDICDVAAGRVDGYFEEGVHPWDYAAASLVARGAGARFEIVTGAGGAPLVICAPEHGFDETREALVQSGYMRE
ncbi:inositol monophosphatase family protein [Nocardioides sp.]|uniref:inositol monophosphatase family protein n=1 Tax=Nocardioides sp. TaxID=35761 RepID=UPI0039E66D3E